VRKISHGEEVAQVNEEGTLVAEPGRVEKGGVGGPRAALTRRIKLMLIGLSLSTVFIFIRYASLHLALKDNTYLCLATQLGLPYH
jgi:hypothetical protein